MHFYLDRRKIFKFDFAFIIMVFDYLSDIELRFIFSLIMSIVFGFVIGLERESRHKDAGISTHAFVIGGAMLFTFISSLDTESTSRIAAQIVAGIGFIGAGLIFKEGETIRNLTTASSIWFAAAIGMAIGFEYYIVASFATVVAIFFPRIPHFQDWKINKKKIKNKKL